MAVPVAPFTVIPLSDVDPDSPLTSSLLDSLRLNDQNLFAQLVGDPVASPTFTPAAEHDHDGVNSKTVTGADFILVERKELSADALSVTFTGLDGDTDEVYRIVGRIDGAVSATARDLVLRINADATQANYDGAHLKYDGGSVTSNTHSAAGGITTAGMLIFPALDNTIELTFEGILHARRTVQTVTLARQWIWKATDGAASTGYMGGTAYSPSASNLTSIFIGVDGGAAQLGKGSTIELFKLRQ